ncbi:hypothetical protein CSV69_04380 [Sporosarcina sp. P26b]|nr:hypothetical protein CSV69_04380 [Sporosarcina sp. P26b]
MTVCYSSNGYNYVSVANSEETFIGIRVSAMQNFVLITIFIFLDEMHNWNKAVFSCIGATLDQRLTPVKQSDHLV